MVKLIALFRLKYILSVPVFLERSANANTMLRPLQYVNVQLYDQNGLTLQSTNTDSSGNYLFSGLSVNTYKICFFTNRNCSSQCWQNTTANTATATPINVASTTSQIIGINAALQAAAIVTGKVTSNGTNGIQNVLISVSDTNGNPIQGVPGSQTRCIPEIHTWRSTRAVFTNSFNGQSTGYISQWYNDKANSASADTITVSESVTTQVLMLQLTLGGTITGQVTKSGAIGIQNISVQFA